MRGFLQDRVLAGQPCRFREMRQDPAPVGRLFQRCLEMQKEQYLRAAAMQQ